MIKGLKYNDKKIARFARKFLLASFAISSVHKTLLKSRNQTCFPEKWELMQDAHSNKSAKVKPVLEDELGVVAGADAGALVGQLVSGDVDGVPDSGLVPLTCPAARQVADS